MAAKTTPTQKIQNDMFTRTINDILTSKDTTQFETAICNFTKQELDINDTFYRVYEFGNHKRIYQRDDIFLTPEYPYPNHYDYHGIPPPKIKKTCLLYEIIITRNIDALRELLYKPHSGGITTLDVNNSIITDLYNAFSPHAKYETPLYIACGYFNNKRPSSIEIIHELLNHGAYPNGHPDRKSRRQYLNPMKQILDIMLRTGCDREKFAALQSMLETLIDYGGDITYKYLYPTTDTILHHIIRNTKIYNYEYRNMLRGHKQYQNKPTQEQICDFVKMLFKYGVDVTTRLPYTNNSNVLDVLKTLVKEQDDEDYEYDYARPLLILLEKEFNWKRRFKLMSPILRRRVNIRIMRLQHIKQQTDEETWNKIYNPTYQQLVKIYK